MPAPPGTKHPRELGFRLGLAVWVSQTDQIERVDWEEDVKGLRDFVYVAVRSDGVVLKVGETGGTLHDRWDGILRLVAAQPAQRRYRPSEWKARDEWRKQVQGQSFEVWLKCPDLIRLEYCGMQIAVRSRNAEEAFLDAYYRPCIGKPLSRRGQEI